MDTNLAHAGYFQVTKMATGRKSKLEGCIRPAGGTLAMSDVCRVRREKLRDREREGKRENINIIRKICIDTNKDK